LECRGRCPLYVPEFLGACPILTLLLRRTICDHLRRSRPEKILDVFQRIRLRFFRACGLASGHSSFASSRRQCPTGSQDAEKVPCRRTGGIKRDGRVCEGLVEWPELQRIVLSFVEDFVRWLLMTLPEI